MSDYKKITRHPVDGNWEVAQYRDNYFGPHRYAVQFENGIAYPIDQVQEAQLKEFWAADVIETLALLSIDELEFLQKLDEVYKQRWERDPIEGEGAVDFGLDK